MIADEARFHDEVMEIRGVPFEKILHLRLAVGLAGERGERADGFPVRGMIRALEGLLPHQPQRGATSQPQATPGVGSRDPGRALKGCHNTNDPSPYCRAPSGLMITGHREPRALP